MKTLTSSSKFIVDKNRNSGLFSSYQKDNNRTEICSFGSRKVSFGFLHLVSVRNRGFKAVPCLSSKSEEDIQTSEAQNQEKYESNTVHVKFQLQRECMFGEQFLIVGDDPMFGLWDPTDAIPLSWSEGHLWTVEMDIPIVKVIQFKFILKEKTGKISWQPGPDRILQTWESTNKITVFEDWNSAESQKIIEGEFNNLNGAVSDSSEKFIVAENLTYPNEEPVPNLNDKYSAVNFLVSNETPSQEKPKAIVAENISNEVLSSALNFLVSNETPSQEKPKAIVAENISNEVLSSEVNFLVSNETPSQEKPKAIVAENISNEVLSEKVLIYPDQGSVNTSNEVLSNEVLSEKALIYPDQESVNISKKDPMITELGENGITATMENDTSTGIEENMINYEGDPVLIPGLNPMQTLENEEIIQDEDGKRIALDGTYEVQDHNMPEVNENQDPEVAPVEETAKMVHSEEANIHDDRRGEYLAKIEDNPEVEPVDNNVVQNDMEWGRKAMEKVLNIFGLL